MNDQRFSNAGLHWNHLGSYRWGRPMSTIQCNHRRDFRCLNTYIQPRLLQHQAAWSWYSGRSYSPLKQFPPRPKFRVSLFASSCAVPVCFGSFFVASFPPQPHLQRLAFLLMCMFPNSSGWNGTANFRWQFQKTNKQVLEKIYRENYYWRQKTKKSER